MVRGTVWWGSVLCSHDVPCGVVCFLVVCGAVCCCVLCDVMSVSTHVFAAVPRGGGGRLASV